MQVWPTKLQLHFVRNRALAKIMPAPYYTVEEANAALPRVRTLVGKILNIRKKILASQPEIWPLLEKSATNGGNLRTTELVFEFEKLRASLRKLREMNIFVKDINTGLIDFLGKRDGDDVYLCWKYDEPEVAFWHSLESGFAGRKKI